MIPSNDPSNDTSSAASSICSISRPSSASSAPPGEPLSSLAAGKSSILPFEIRDTPTAGRAVFATKDIQQGDLIWRSDDLTLSVLLREYRREVCGQCFQYDQGRDLRVRDAGVGFAFCSTDCKTTWQQWNGEVGVQAWTAVEKLVKGRSKEDDDLVDVDLPRPATEEIISAWDAVAAQAALIRSAREAEHIERSKSNGETDTDRKEPVKITKQHRKAIQNALQQRVSPDVLSFCVSGLIWRHTTPHAWGTVLALAPNPTPYYSTVNLAAFVRSYLHLLAVLPVPLLRLTTPETLILLSSRDSHNSFGIRSLDDDGDEFFGFGCWPAASYFNHSCAPNVAKSRDGRSWLFRAAAPVIRGGELNITYLSGEERKLSRAERMGRLKRTWGFECGCTRCA